MKFRWKKKNQNRGLFPTCQVCFNENNPTEQNPRQEMASVLRTNPSPLPLLPRRTLSLFKNRSYAPGHEPLPRFKGRNIPRNCKLAGNGPRVRVPAPRGRRGERAFARPAAGEVRVLPDLERSFPSSSGRARTLPPSAHRRSGVNNYDLFLYFASDPPCPSTSRSRLTHFSCLGEPRKRRGRGALAAGPRWCRVSRHTPASCGG